MTIAVSLKVQDGIVVAADSASTLMVPGGLVANVFNNANKIVNLRKGLPIGIVFWGAGGIGDSSITTLAKDLRARLSGDEPDWRIDPVAYTIEEVVTRAVQFFRREHYEPAFADAPDPKPALGFFVFGYSSGAPLAECWETNVDSSGTWIGPQRMMPGPTFGSLWRGDPEWITRLVHGFGSALPSVLVDQFGLPADQIDQAMDIVRRSTEVSLLHPAMPIQDTVDLGAFLVDLTKAVSRFLPGAATVGGPTEVATITKHEGFKWVMRKHYYDSSLNPPVEAT